MESTLKHARKPMHLFLNMFRYFRGIKMKKREIFMLSALAFSCGIVFGFLLSPIKQGITVTGGDKINNSFNKKAFSN